MCLFPAERARQEVEPRRLPRGAGSGSAKTSTGNAQHCLGKRNKTVRVDCDKYAPVAQLGEAEKGKDT